MNCPDCGNEVDQTRLFCPVCGAPIVARMETKQKTTESKNVKTEQDVPVTSIAKPAKSLIIGIALFICVIAIVAAVFYVVNIFTRGTSIVDGKLFVDQALQSYVLENIDANGDSYLNDTEKNAVTTITGLENRGVKSLKGIEVFENLTTLDVPNSGIEELWRAPNHGFLGAVEESESLPNLTTINLSGNNIRQCILPSDSCINLKSLDVSNCQVQSFSIDDLSLKSLDCSNNEISKTLSVRAGRLEYLDCSNNCLEKLEFITGGGFLSGPATPESLKTLYCQNNNLIKLGENFDELGGYSFYLDYIESIDISNNPGIRVSEDGTFIAYDG